MAIVRTSEFLLKPGTDGALLRLENVIKQLEIDVISISESSIKASAGRAIRKNRWASEILIEELKQSGVTSIRISIDMMGTKHYEVMDELLDPVQDLIDDRGLADAVTRLGKAGSIFAKLELRMLPSLLRGQERVLSLASGNHDKKLCAICLTTERILFVDKGLLSSQLSVSELLISSIVGISTKRSRMGEGIEITVSGSTFEVERVMHGQADELARKIREVQSTLKNENHPKNDVVTSETPLDALKKLSDLHSSGVLTDDEYAEMKAKLIKHLKWQAT
jgi:hypothetical protein